MRSSPPEKALVLGPSAVAERIASDLEACGFVAELQERQGIHFPEPSQPHASERLRELLARVKHSGVQWIHPGVSVWAERSELSVIGQELGLNVICPPARVVNLFGNKLNLLGEAERLGIPNLVLSFDPLYSVREIEKLAKDRDRPFPLVLKSIRGWAGFGLHVVYNRDDLEKKAPLWLEQLRNNFGEAIVFAERYVEGARHVVVPFARFSDGRSHFFPSSDASLQCRFRKIVEFCPSFGIDPEVNSQLQKWTLQLAEETGFVGVGALEFMVDGSRGYLLEGSARLNSGFEAWERVAGTNAVAWQLATLAGDETLPLSKPTKESSASLSVRLYSEDALLQLPQPGRVHEVSTQREWILSHATARLRLSVKEGSEVAAESGDGLLGLITVAAKDRAVAINTAVKVLDESWIAGSLQTNERFVRELLLHAWVREGMFHAGFVEEEFVPEVRPPAGVFTTFASICAYLYDPKNPGLGAKHRWVVGDQWVKPDPAKLAWEQVPSLWSFAGRRGLSGVLLRADGKRQRVCAFPTSDDRWQVRLGLWVMSVRRFDLTATSVKKGVYRLSSLVGGKVYAILYKDGAEVPAHETLVIVQSLKMLVPHALPVNARLIRWKVVAEDHVEAGQDLADFESVEKASF